MHKITLSDGVLGVEVSGKLTRADYEELIPSWEKMIARQGALRMLFIMKDFGGWEPGAAWEDFEFDLKYARQIDRIAMVGEKKWQEWLSKLGALFVKADVKYFDAAELSEAERWIRAG
jgi:SpoIIAA-like